MSERTIYNKSIQFVLSSFLCLIKYAQIIIESILHFSSPCAFKFNIDNFNLVELPNHKDASEETFMGQTFSTIEEAYILYKNYDKRSGFLVQEDRPITKKGNVALIYFSTNHGHN